MGRHAGGILIMVKAPSPGTCKVPGKGGRTARRKSVGGLHMASIPAASLDRQRAVKRPWRGWFFYALAAFLVIAYILHGGLYSGSSLDFTGHVDGKAAYKTVCHYLYLNGKRDDVSLSDGHFCPPLHP